MISGDLKQNIIITLFLLVKHNFWVILYASGLIISIILALIRPTRYTIFMIIGFALLIGAFEYSKHVIDPLKEQTLTSLITERPHYKLQRIIEITIAKVLPVALYISGFGFVFLGIISSRFKGHKKI